MLTARDVMTPDVETVEADDEVSEVLTKLARRSFNGFPVVEDGALVGIVTKGDLVDLFQPSDRTLWIPIGFPPFVDVIEYPVDVSWDDLDLGIDLAKHTNKPISTVMTADVVTVDPDTPMPDLLDLLGDPDRDINRLPVVEDGAIVGIVTREDALRSLREDRAA
jgi:CBS domain-containing protein